MDTGARTFLVECYEPGIRQADVEIAAARARSAASAAAASGQRLTYLGALLVAGDDAVFHAFEADGPEAVESASVAAQLEFTRIVESVSVSADQSIEPLEGLLRSVRAAPGPAQP